MPADQNTVAAAPAATRAAVTNGSRAMLFSDGRSAGARRYRDILNALAGELGGMASLPESARQIVRRAAQTCIECELLECRRAAGEDIDPVAYSTACNANSRALVKVEALTRAAKPAPQKRLREHLAANYGGTGASP